MSEATLRAVIQQLLDTVKPKYTDPEEIVAVARAINAASAELAKAEDQAQQPIVLRTPPPLSDEELHRLTADRFSFSGIPFTDEQPFTVKGYELIAFARSVRDRTTAALSDPVVGPAAPSRDDLRDVFYAHADSSDDGPPWLECERFCDAASALLARWGTPAPVAVAERPILKINPFNDDQGRCWCGTGASLDTSGDIDVEIPPSWELREPCAQDDSVLPANAIPLPAAPGEGAS